MPRASRDHAPSPCEDGRPHRGGGGLVMDDRCRIGNEPATRSLGRYRFCERHYERALRQRGSLWRADLISLLALAAFVVIVYVVDELLKPRLAGTSLITVGVIIALVPAILWLIF